MKPNRPFLTAIFLITWLNGCQQINGLLGIKPTDTATDQVYKYQNTYNIALEGVIFLRTQRLIPDDVYNKTFLPAKRAAWQALTELKKEAPDDDKAGKQLDPNSVAYRALNAALDQMSLVKSSYTQPNSTGVTANGPGNNSSINSRDADGIEHNPPVGSQPTDANPGATPAD